MKDLTRHFREQFAGQAQIIKRLLAEDPEFPALCEDYEVCVNALRYWIQSQAPEAETRVKEYRTLVRELREEIAQALEARQMRQPE